MPTDDQPLRITPPGNPLDGEVLDTLRRHLEKTPDLAFAHLVDVEVLNQGDGPDQVLFVWLVPAAMRSLRAALNLVSEAVAKALPSDRYLDVVILNSAPEMLHDVERAGCLFLELDAEERRRAVAAAGP